MDLEEHGVLSNKLTGVQGVPSDIIDELRGVTGVVLR